MLAVVLISIGVLGHAFAANDNNNLNGNLAGLYVGEIATDEQFTLQLSKDGAVRAISGLEPRPGYENDLNVVIIPLLKVFNRS